MEGNTDTKRKETVAALTIIKSQWWTGSYAPADANYYANAGGRKDGGGEGGSAAPSLSVILVILSKIRVVPVPQNRRTFAPCKQASDSGGASA